MLNRERCLYSTVSVHWDTHVTRRFTFRLSSYLIVDNVVYLTIAEKSYPRKLAFSYLDELSKEFAITYGPKVESARKPYAFVGFGMSISTTPAVAIVLMRSAHPIDTFMSKTARLYQDSRTATAAAGSNEGNLDKLNNELQDVTRIMTKNMEELLWRGDSLDSAYRRLAADAELTVHLILTQKCPISQHHYARNPRSIGKPRDK